MLIRSRLAEPGHGKVLVVDAGNSRSVAVLGDRMAQLGLDNGWAGVLVNGAIRDSRRWPAWTSVSWPWARSR